MNADQNTGKMPVLRFYVRLSVGALEQAAESEIGQFLQNGGGGKIGSVDDVVDAGRIFPDMLEDELLAIGEIELGSGRFFFARFRCGELRLMHVIGQRTERADDVLQFCHQRRPIANQLMSSGGHWIVDAAWE